VSRALGTPRARRAVRGAAVRVAACVAAFAAATLAPGPARGQAPPSPATADSRVLESFDDASVFRALPSDGVRLALSADSGVQGGALRMTFDFAGHAGYAVAHRAFALGALPARWVATLRVRGEARPNTLEIKLVDSSGTNVWWLHRPALVVSRDWTQLRFRSSDLTFAWGPLGGGPPKAIAALEIAVTAGEGGAGWIALDDLRLTAVPRLVADRVRPRVTTSSSARSGDASSLLPRDFFRPPSGGLGTSVVAATRWRSARDGAQWVRLELGGPRQLSGLVLDWSTADWPVDYDVETSDDGTTWRTARAIRGSGGGRRFVHLPNTEAAALRLALHRSSAGRGYGLDAVRVLADSAAPTRSAFVERVAQGSDAGDWPRPLTAQQSYWTIVGVPRDDRDALFSEDGSLESRPGSFSIEPFLVVDGRVLTWRDGRTNHALDEGALPIPTSRRTMGDVELASTAFATGAPTRSVVWLRYRVVNRASRMRDVRLVATVRPVQVDPPWQFLGIAGGAASVRTIAWDGRALVVNDTDAIVPVTRPETIAAMTFDSGPIAAALRRGALPKATSVHDTTGLAEGALAWELRLRGRDSADVWLALPAPGAEARLAVTPRESVGATSIVGPEQLAEARQLWHRELRTMVELPGSGTELTKTLRSALAYVLINANGPAIQPGTRSYRRSWIRDGALTSSALLRLGHASDVRDYLEWYAARTFDDGKVPCCIDARGADPVTENDADGELLFLAAEYWRVTRDTATVARLWPRLARTAAHLDWLQHTRRSEQYRSGDSAMVFGLLPPSISHEGYSDKPAYSYWDDWWAVRGLDDAALLARLAGKTAAAAEYRAAGAAMRHNVVASLERVMAHYRIPTLAGAADRGDLDPTSTTIALEPAQALADLPRAALLATFDSAWATLQRRRDPRTPWTIYTPYEWREVGSFIRLGQPARAQSLARWLLASRRPPEWNQWSEAVWRDPRAPKFIGDMPHGWVMSDFIRATLDMVAYERERDSMLVVGAGIPGEWTEAAGGVRVQGLHTWYGALALTVQGTARGARFTIAGVDAPGGIELRVPFDRRARWAAVDGVAAPLVDDGRAVIVRAPAVVELRY
jgi:hypothetical protein